MRPETASRLIYQVCVQTARGNTTKLKRYRKYLQSRYNWFVKNWTRDDMPQDGFVDRYRSMFEPNPNELIHISDRHRAPYRLAYLLNYIDYLGEKHVR